ncbi:MAG: CehA/McbA family metallohydrolase [Myxococcales bacterium]|nr:CehA/McbA family metallohydrolase [Myxococcales bacterium]
MLLAQQRDRYLRSPKLRAAEEGALLSAIAWDQDGEAILEWRLDAHGTPISPPRSTWRGDRVIALEPGSWPPEPSGDIGAERRSVHEGWSVHLDVGHGPACVRVLHPNQRETIVWKGHAIASAPALYTSQEGLWVAFHHNLRPDTDEPDLTKWITLRHVSSGGQVFRPAHRMLGQDPDRDGIEQGFEFPTLVVLQDGTVVVFGRGSHRFWWQSLGQDGWSERTALGEGPFEWGCRGRRVAASLMRDGSILTARREREGIVIERLEVTPRGAPRLQAETVAMRGKILAAESNEGRTERCAADPAMQEGRITLFGDIHQHSAHSDGCGSAEEVYLRARDYYRDDFAGLSDHESFLGKRIGPGEWGYLQAVADAYDEPREFATLIAYEWTAKAHPGPGHKVVYTPAAGADVVSRDVVPEGRELLEAVGRQGGFAVPHHIGWTGANLDAHDERLQPVWEICSSHGCYEHVDHPLGQRGDLREQMALDALRQGHRFGFIACSDSHGLVWHHGVSRKRDAFRTGLTAVQALSRTRKSVLEALRQRRCYATSGTKIVLDVRADGHPMGSLLTSRGPVQVKVRARGTAAIARIVLIGPDGELAGIASQKAYAELDAMLDAPFFYARVEQVDGEMAWSSPIFIEP